MFIFQFAIFFGFFTISRAGSFDVAEFEKYKYQIEFDDKLPGILSNDEFLNLSFEDEKQIESFFFQQIPSETDPRNHFITNKAGQKFLCQVPNNGEKTNDEKTEIKDDSLNAKSVHEIVSISFLVIPCIRKKIGWWEYEFCHGKKITQSHSMKGKSDFIEYKLGTFMGDRRMPGFTQSTKDKLLYLEEDYPMGTLCNLFAKKVARKTIVRYECDLRLSIGEAYIGSIVETSTCEYLMIIKIGSLCYVPQFISTDDLVAPLGIKCSPYVDKEKIKQLSKRIFGKITRKKEALRLLPILMEKLNSAYRRLHAFKRTSLISEEQRNFRIQHRINEQIEVLNREYLNALHMSTAGEKLDEKKYQKLESFTKIIEIFVQAEKYTLSKDQDNGNFYYYLMDREWPKDEFPRTLDYVDFLNGYHVEIEQIVVLIDAQESTEEMIRLISSLDPNLWQNNFIVDRDQMLEKLIENLPIWFPKISANAIFKNAGKEDFMKRLVDRFYLSIVEDDYFYYQPFNSDLNEHLVDEISHYVLIIWFQEHLPTSEVRQSKFWMEHLKLMEMMMVAIQHAKILYLSENPDLLDFVDAVDVFGRPFDLDEIEIAETMDWHEYYEYVEGTFIPGKRQSIQHQQEQLLITRTHNLRQTIFEEIWANTKKTIAESWRTKLQSELDAESRKSTDIVIEAIEQARLAVLYENEDKVGLVEMWTKKMLKDEDFQEIMEILTEEELEYLVSEQVDDMLKEKKEKKQEKNYWGKFRGLDDGFEEGEGEGGEHDDDDDDDQNEDQRN